MSLEFIISPNPGEDRSQIFFSSRRLIVWASRGESLHARLSDALVILKGFVIMHFIRMSLIVLFPLQNCQQALKHSLVRRKTRGYISWLPDVCKYIAVQSVPSKPSLFSSRRQFQIYPPHRISGCPEGSCQWQSWFLICQLPHCSGPRWVSAQDWLAHGRLAQTWTEQLATQVCLIRGQPGNYRRIISTPGRLMINWVVVKVS